MTITDMIEPAHPGEFLMEDFIDPRELWMNLQSNYELRLARRALRDKVAAITPLVVA